ncbi:TPA: type II secretion system F family protein [Candidatus Micrarchaeota archaeon]|nr:type II secretion system F family protein [Candidatus Micrarchaeota archaeon]
MVARRFIPAQDRQRKYNPFTPLAELLLPYFPDLKKKLVGGQIQQSPIEFLERAVMSTIFLSIALIILTTMFFVRINATLLYIIPFIAVYPFLIFSFMMLYPDAYLKKRQREIDRDIVFAGRHLVIALRSGMPLFDSMVGVSSGHGEVSKEFNSIVEKVTIGTPLSQAIREVAQNNPSKSFVRLTMQIANALSSGADVASSLDAVLDQISKEQMIDLKEYGQKLTPMVMFFMIFGIIMPSLGVAFAIILFSLISGGKVGITSSILVLVFALIAVVQFLFLAMVENSRPNYVV